MIPRELLRGSLELMVLSEISAEPCYGYQILSGLKRRSDGRVDLKAGTLYPILHKLERERFVSSHWDESSGRDRKFYTITERGKLKLQADARAWLDYSTCMKRILNPLLSLFTPEPAVAPEARAKR